MAKVNVETVRAVMAAARECAMEMFQNASFIQGELPELDMPDELRARTEQVCTERIVTWMGLDMVQLHELVAVAFALVAESATNIVNAFNATAEAAGKIQASA